MKKFLSMALVVVMTLALFATVPITAEAKTFKKTGGFYTFLSKKRFQQQILFICKKINI